MRCAGWNDLCRLGRESATQNGQGWSRAALFVDIPDLSIQHERLRSVGCIIIRSEKVSGASRDGRDELSAIMEFIREGDELVVVRLDRLGRSTRDILNLVHELQGKGAILTVLEPRFSTTDVAGPILLTVLGMVAETERRFIRERQQAGIEVAKAKGVYKGRKPSVPVEKVRTMLLLPPNDRTGSRG